MANPKKKPTKQKKQDKTPEKSSSVNGIDTEPRQSSLLDIHGNPVPNKLNAVDIANSSQKTIPPEIQNMAPDKNISNILNEDYELNKHNIPNPQDAVKTPPQIKLPHSADFDREQFDRNKLYDEYVSELKLKNIEPHYSKDEFNELLQGKTQNSEALQNNIDKTKENEIYGEPGTWKRFKSYATGRLSLSPTTDAIKNASLMPILTKGLESISKVAENKLDGKNAFELTEKEKEYFDSKEVQDKPTSFLNKHLLPGISSGLLTVTSLGGLNTVLTQNFSKLATNPALLNALSLTVLSTPEYSERFAKGDNIESILKDASLSFTTGALLGSNPFRKFLPREIYGAIIPTIPNEINRQVEGTADATELVSELTVNALMTFLNANGVKKDKSKSIAQDISKGNLDNVPEEIKNNSKFKELIEGTKEWITSPHLYTGSKNIGTSLNSTLPGPENKNDPKSARLKFLQEKLDRLNKEIDDLFQHSKEKNNADTKDPDSYSKVQTEMLSDPEYKQKVLEAYKLDSEIKQIQDNIQKTHNPEASQKSFKSELERKNEVYTRLTEIAELQKKGDNSKELLDESNKLLNEYDSIDKRLTNRIETPYKTTENIQTNNVDYSQEVTFENIDDFTKKEYELSSKLDEILHNKKNNITNDLNSQEETLKTEWKTIKDKIDGFIDGNNKAFDRNKIKRMRLNNPELEEEIKGKFVDSNELTYPNPRKRAVSILQENGYSKQYINSLDQYQLLEKASQHEKAFSTARVKRYEDNQKRIDELTENGNKFNLPEDQKTEVAKLQAENKTINIAYEKQVLNDTLIPESEANPNPLKKYTAEKQYKDYDSFVKQLSNDELDSINEYLKANNNDKPLDEFLENNKYLIEQNAVKQTDITEQAITDIKEDNKIDSDNEVVTKAVEKLNSVNARDIVNNIDNKIAANEVDVTKHISLEPDPIKQTETKSFRQAINDIYTTFFDKFNPLKRIEDTLLKENIKLADPEKPYLRSRLYPAILDKIESWIFNKAITYDNNGNVVVLGKGLESILTQDKMTNLFKGKENLLPKITGGKQISPQDLLSVYMTNRAVIERTLQGQEHTIPLNEAIANVHAIDKYFPAIKEVFETDIRQFNDNLLQVGKDYFGDNKISLLNIYRQDYASLERSLDEFDKTGKFNINIRNFADSNNPSKKSKGNADLEYKNSLENMIKNTFLILDRIERNTIGKTIINAMEKSPSLKEVIQEIKPLKSIQTDTDLFGNSETLSESDYYTKQLNLAERVNRLTETNPVKPVIPDKVIDNLTLNLFDEATPKPEQIDLFGKAKKDIIQTHNEITNSTIKEYDAVLEEYYSNLQNVYKDIATFKRNDALKYSDHIERLENIATDITEQMSVLRNNKYDLMRSKADTNDIDLKIHETIDFIKQEKNAKIDIDVIKNKLYEAQEYERTRQTASLKNIPHITFFDNGVKRTFRVPTDIYQSIKGLNDAHTEVAIKILSIPTKILQTGATITPSFTVPNFIRDQWHAFVNTGAVPFVNYFKGLGHYLGRTEIFDKWISSQARGTNYFTVDRESLQGIMEKMKESTYQDAVREFSDPYYLLHLLQDSPFQLLKNPYKSTKGILQAMGNLSEVPTRIGIFELGKKKGMSDMEAALLSREGTTDFQRSGSIMSYTGKDDGIAKRIPLTTMKILYNTIPFLNARLQGIDRTVREFANRPQTALLRTLPLVTATLFFKFLNDDDEYYRIRPQWEKDTYWHLPRQFSKPILSVLTPILQQAGVKSALLADDEFIKIPKGDIGYMFGSVLEKMLSGEDAFDIFLESSKILSPVGDPEQGALIPTIIKPFLENEVTNEKSFSKEPVSYFSKEEQRLIPGQDTKYNTSETFERIGKLLNNRWFTPTKLQNYYENTTGNFGREMLEAFDGVLRYIDIYDKDKAPIKELGDQFIIKRFITKRDVYTDDLKKFYELHNKAKDVYVTYNKFKERQDFAAADDYLSNAENNKMYQLYFETKAVNQKLIDLNKERSEINKKYNDDIQKINAKIEINKLINSAIKQKPITDKDIIRNLLKEEAQDSNFYYKPTDEEMNKGIIDYNRVKDEIVREKAKLTDNTKLDDTTKAQRIKKLERLEKKMKEVKQNIELNTPKEKPSENKYKDREDIEFQDGYYKIK